MKFKQRAGKYLILKILAGILLLLIILFSAAYIFAVAHKKEILQKVTSAINENINGNVSIGSIDFTMFEKFPALSIRVNNIEITDSMISYHNDTLFRAKSLSFQIRIFRLIAGDVSFGSFKLKDASISLLKTNSGISNSQLIKAKKESFKGEKKKNGKSIPKIQKILLDNVSFSLVDSSKMKFFGFKFLHTIIDMDQVDSLITMTIKGSMDFKSLTFNNVKGGYMMGKSATLNLNADFNLNSSELIINNGNIAIDKQVINLSANFNFQSAPTMHLHFDSKSILTSVAFSVLPTLIGKKLANYQLENPVMVSIEVDGPIAAGSKPAVDVYFKSTNNRMSFAGRSFDSLNILGVFINHIDSTKINDDHNSRVYLPVFNSMFNGVLPMKAKLMVTDLMEPQLQMTADLNLDKEDEAHTLNSERLTVYSGLTDIHLDFLGPLVNYVDTPNSRLKADIRGSVKMKNLSFDFVPTGDEFRNLNGSFNFDENDLFLDSLHFEMNENSATINGSITNFIAVLFLPDIKAKALLDMKVGTIDFNSFKKKPKKDSSLTEVKKPAPKKKSDKNKVARKIDMLVNKLELDFNFTADKIIFDRFTATEVASKISITSDQISFSNTTMKTAGGTFLLNGGISQMNKPVHTLSLSSVIRNVDISSLMYSFNDFGQKGLTHEQISGKVSANINFTAPLSKGFILNTKNMKGSVDLTVKNGALKGFEGFKEVQKYVLKNRDFSNIQFAEIRNKFVMNQSLIDISNLELYSSVMTLFITGQYDLKKINTNMTIQIPFSNLEKKDAQERMDKSDSTLKKGGSFYFKATNNKEGKILLLPTLVKKKSGDNNADKTPKSESSSNKKKNKTP